MFEVLRRKLGIFYTKLYFKQDRDAITDFTRAISDARVALVFLPDNDKDLQIARFLLPSLQSKFKGNRLTLVLPEHITDPMRDVYMCEIIRVRDQDLNSLFVPKEALRRRIREKSYDVALDLNIQLHLVSAFLCKVSRSQVRIGITKQYADTFYNLQLRTDPTANSKAIYERFSNCLAMF
jgi:ADP-heptose:LPS heptosyltransferase